MAGAMAGAKAGAKDLGDAVAGAGHTGPRDGARVATTTIQAATACQTANLNLV